MFGATPPRYGAQRHMSRTPQQCFDYHGGCAKIKQSKERIVRSFFVPKARECIADRQLGAAPPRYGAQRHMSRTPQRCFDYHGGCVYIKQSKERIVRSFFVPKSRACIGYRQLGAAPPRYGAAAGCSDFYTRIRTVCYC